MKKLILIMMFILGINTFAAFVKPFTILFLGIDKEGTKNRSDSIMLIKSTPFKNNKVLSIPRDSNVYITSTNKRDKLGHAYSYGGKNCVK